MDTAEATDMYLKGTLLIKKAKGTVRAADIAAYLKITKPTATEMLRKLHQSGFLDYKPYKGIKLTKKGLQRAQSITRKYETIKSFLTDVLKLEVDDRKVHNEACKLEHVFSDESAKRLQKILPKLRKIRKGKNFK